MTYSIHYTLKRGDHRNIYGNAQAILSAAKCAFRNKLKAVVKDAEQKEIGRVWEEAGKWNYSIDFGKQSAEQ